MPPEPRRFPFMQLDVFSSRPFEGNSLAVFPDARGLDDNMMQTLAREMNLSETTFVLPRDPATERERVTFFRVPYDFGAAMRKIRAAGLPDRLARRLERGS